MPRPARADTLRAAVHAFRQQQEESLAALEAFLESYEPHNEVALEDLKEVGKREGSKSPPTTPGLKDDDSKQLHLTRSAFADTGRRLQDLISEDEGAKFEHSITGWCKYIISKPQFDWIMGVVIFFNSVCIGIETQRSIPAMQGFLPDWPSEALDLFFVTVYLIEIAMRLIANGRSNFKDPWFLFDVVLVGMGVIGNIVVPILNVTDEGAGETPFAKILVVRSLRLLRLVRAIRMLHIFRTVWRLVYGLLTSGNAMLSTFFILLLTLYIFSCLGVEIITKDLDLAQHPDTAYIVDYHFGSLQRTWLTLAAFVLADSVSAVYTPLCIQRPYLIVYFVAVMLTVSVALMNLVTAVLVEGALANAANDKELSKHDMKQKVKKFAPKVMEVFKEIDEDGSGTIDRHEVTKIDLQQLPIELSSEYIEGLGLEELFDMLDVEGKGTLTQVEFAEGFLNLLTMDIPVHQMKTFKLLQLHSASLDHIKTKLTILEDSMKRK